MTEYPLELKHPKHWTLLFLDGLAPRLHATYAKFYDPGLDVNVAWSSRRHRKGRRVKVSVSICVVVFLLRFLGPPVVVVEDCYDDAGSPSC